MTARSLAKEIVGGKFKKSCAECRSQPQRVRGRTFFPLDKVVEEFTPVPGSNAL